MTATTRALGESLGYQIGDPEHENSR